jgi:hypothetical protein
MLESITSLNACSPVGLITLKSDKEISMVVKATFGKFKSLIISGSKKNGLLEGKELAQSFEKLDYSNYIIENSFLKALDDLVKTSSKLNVPGVIFGSHYVAKEVFDKFGYLI